MSSKKQNEPDKSIETLKESLIILLLTDGSVYPFLLALVTVAFTFISLYLTGKAVDEIVSQGNVDFAALINIM